MSANVGDALLSRREVCLRPRPCACRRQGQDERENQYRAGNREPAHAGRNTFYGVRRQIEQRKRSVRKRFTEAKYD